MRDAVLSRKMIEVKRGAIVSLMVAVGDQEACANKEEMRRCREPSKRQRPLKYRGLQFSRYQVRVLKLAESL